MIIHERKRKTLLFIFPPGRCCGRPKDCERPKVYLTATQFMVLSWAVHLEKLDG